VSVALVAVIVLGLSAGAMLTEGVVLVPYWRALPPRDFLDWFGANEPRLFAFYSPLEIGGAVLTMVAAGLCAVRRRPDRGLLAVSGALAVAVLVTSAVRRSSPWVGLPRCPVRLGKEGMRRGGPGLNLQAPQDRPAA
jgi:hypothetical protein